MELNPVALFAVLFVLITMPILFVLCSHMNTTEAITPRQNDYSMRHIIERVKAAKAAMETRQQQIDEALVSIVSSNGSVPNVLILPDFSN